MTTVGVSEARTHLSRLLREVETDEKIVITRRGVEIAMLIPIPHPPTRLKTSSGRERA